MDFFLITLSKFNIEKNFDKITSHLKLTYENLQLIIKVKSIEI